VTTIERRPNKVALALVSVAVAALGLAWIVTRSSGESEAERLDGCGRDLVDEFACGAARVAADHSQLRVAALEMGLPSDSDVVLFAHTLTRTP
jgi:hypothetical protein